MSRLLKKQAYNLGFFTLFGLSYGSGAVIVAIGSSPSLSKPLNSISVLRCSMSWPFVPFFRYAILIDGSK